MKAMLTGMAITAAALVSCQNMPPKDFTIHTQPEGAAISINGESVKDPAFAVDASTALEGSVLIIRRGKKKFYFGEIA